MLDSPDAPVASNLHTLTGSSQSGDVPAFLPLASTGSASDTGEHMTPQADPDADLIAAAGEVSRLQDLQDRVSTEFRHMDCHDIPEWLATNGPLEAAIDATVAKPALTFAGLVAKAAALVSLDERGDWSRANEVGRSLADDLTELDPVVALPKLNAEVQEVADLQTLWIDTSARYFEAVDAVSGLRSSDPAYPEATVKFTAADSQDLQLRQRIIGLRSTNVAVLALKAAAVLAHAGGPSSLDDVIARTQDERYVHEEELALSLARDVVDLLGEPVQVLAKPAIGRAELPSPETKPAVACSRRSQPADLAPSTRATAEFTAPSCISSCAC